jgi:hypothetical protein
MVTVRCRHYDRLYEVRLAARSAAEEKKRILEEEKSAKMAVERRIKEQNQRRKKAAVSLQKLWRGMQLRNVWRQVHVLVRLRKCRRNHDTRGVLDAASVLRNSNLLTFWPDGRTTMKRVRGLESFLLSFKDDLHHAGQLIRLLNAQEEVILALKDGTAASSLSDLTKAIRRAETLEVQPKTTALVAAQRCAARMCAKRNVMLEMVHYLEDEMENFNKYFGEMVVVSVPGTSTKGGAVYHHLIDDLDRSTDDSNTEGVENIDMNKTDKDNNNDNDSTRDKDNDDNKSISFSVISRQKSIQSNASYKNMTSDSLEITGKYSDYFT